MWLGQRRGGHRKKSKIREKNIRKAGRRNIITKKEENKNRKVD